MEFYKKTSTGNWILNGEIVTKGIYNMVKVIQEGKEYVRITKNADVNPFFYGLVTSVTKEGGASYADYATLESSVKDFFVDAHPYGEIYGANNSATDTPSADAN